MGLARQFIIFIWKLHQVHFVFLLIVFVLCLFFLSLIGFNLYCWKGIHFSWSNFLTFLYLFLYLICSFHFWFRDLLREFTKKYEILLLVCFLVFFIFLVSEGLLFVSFFWASFSSFLLLNGYSIYGLCLTFWTNEFLGSYS